jgi:cytoskeletal protein RodZ
MPKRTIWLTAGVALGAGSTLWAERRVRRTIEQAAAKLAPDALVAEVGRTARHVAESTGDRFRDAYSEGRNEMQRREQQLWSDLANRGVAITADGLPASAAASGGMKEERRTDTPTTTQIPTTTQTPTQTQTTQTPPSMADDTTRATRRRIAKRRAKSPSHLGN